MKIRPEERSAAKRPAWLTAKRRSRREDALRRFLTYCPTPEGKAAIATRFRTLRAKARMTQRTLGEIIGVSRSCINEIENGRVFPHHTTIERFSDLEQRHESAGRITAALENPCWE